MSEKIRVEDELNYLLTRSFFKNCRDLRATVDKIKFVVEKGRVLVKLLRVYVERVFSRATSASVLEFLVIVAI